MLVIKFSDNVSGRKSNDKFAKLNLNFSFKFGQILSKAKNVTNMCRPL